MCVCMCVHMRERERCQENGGHEQVRVKSPQRLAICNRNRATGPLFPIAGPFEGGAPEPLLAAFLSFPPPDSYQQNSGCRIMSPCQNVSPV